MDLIGALIVLPLVPALLLLMIGHPLVRSGIVKIGAAGVAAGSVLLAVRHLSADVAYFRVDLPGAAGVVLAVEAGITLYLLWACRNIRRHEWWIPTLIVIQAAILGW